MIHLSPSEPGKVLDGNARASGSRHAAAEEANLTANGDFEARDAADGRTALPRALAAWKVLPTEFGGSVEATDEPERPENGILCILGGTKGEAVVDRIAVQRISGLERNATYRLAPRASRPSDLCAERWMSDER
jgi:hypothetical protein